MSANHKTTYVDRLDSEVESPVVSDIDWSRMELCRSRAAFGMMKLSRPWVRECVTVYCLDMPDSDSVSDSLVGLGAVAGWDRSAPRPARTSR
jgi:hypothetical protein